jgi:hypothetical protein
MTWLGAFAILVAGAFLGALAVVWIVLRSNDNLKKAEEKASLYASDALAMGSKLEGLRQACREFGYDFTYDEQSHTWTRKLIGEPPTPESSET